MKTTWKAVLGYESAYEVSSIGEVRRLFSSKSARLRHEDVLTAIRMREEGMTFDKIGEHFKMAGSSIFQAIQSFGKTSSRRGDHRIRKPYANFDGYLYLNLCKDGEVKTRMVHQLVAEAFIGPCPEGLELNHKNGNPSDNRVENLEYVTHTENLVKRMRIGNTAPSLEESDAIFMRGMKASGYTVAEIATAFKVTLKTVYSVLQKKTHF